MMKVKYRDLTTVEEIGIKVIQKKVGTIGIIKGAYIGGFIVEIPAENKKLGLPFENIDQFHVKK